MGINRCDLIKGSIFFLTDSSLKIEGYTHSVISGKATARVCKFLWQSLHSDKKILIQNVNLYCSNGRFRMFALHSSKPHQDNQPCVFNLPVLERNPQFLPYYQTLSCNDKSHWWCMELGLALFFTPNNYIVLPIFTDSCGQSECYWASHRVEDLRPLNRLPFIFWHVP